MPDLYKAWINGTVRHWLGGVFMFFAAKGYVTAAQAEETILWLSGAVAVWLWSLYEKRRNDKLIARLKGGDPNGV